MKNTKFSFNRAWLVLTALLMSALVAVSFTSCKSDDDDASIYGTWVNKTDTYTETYKITETMFSNGYYEGNNLTVIESSDSSGYIYIKYTKSMNADWSYSENAPDVGKWYAISYKNLTDDTVSISGAYKSGGATSTETLDEAVSEFTIENGYFGTYSDCTRQ
ncbi:hypothetical protein [uncultured Treponema sp.]|uniref:hypothetical protein n=1 Tax=uncultured Treponema sp. TaxID=162155 RepID=UPI0028039B7C|nr:hypothetical protein [uncultured Treponema sp.]